MQELKDRVQKLVEKVEVDEKRKKIRELEAESTHANFWQDHQNAAKKMKEMNRTRRVRMLTFLARYRILDAVVRDEMRVS